MRVLDWSYLNLHLKRTSFPQGILIHHFHNGSLVTDSGNEFVIHNAYLRIECYMRNGYVIGITHRVKLCITLRDEVGDDTRISKGWNILADLIECEQQIAG